MHLFEVTNSQIIKAIRPSKIVVNISQKLFFKNYMVQQAN